MNVDAVEASGRHAGFFQVSSSDLHRIRAEGGGAKDMAAYLGACFEEAKDDAAFITRALGDIARAKGMTQVAQCRPTS